MCESFINISDVTSTAAAARRFTENETDLSLNDYII